MTSQDIPDPEGRRTPLESALRTRRLRRADVVTAPLFVLLGAAVVTAGLRMPLSGTYAGRPVTWYTSPGFFPILLGLLLMLFSTGVLWRAIAEGGHRDLWRHLAAWRRCRPDRQGVSTSGRVIARVVTIWALLGGYILALSFNPFGPLGNWIETRAWAHSPFLRFLTEPDGVNYLLCSFLFLSTFMLLFSRPAHGPPSRIRTAFTVALAALISWGVSYVFTEFLYTPLP